MSFGASSIGTVAYGGGTGGSDIVYYDATIVSPADGAKWNELTTQDFTVIPNSSDGSDVTIEWEWDTFKDFSNSGGLNQAKTTTEELDEQNTTTSPDTVLEPYQWYWRVRVGDGVSSWSKYTEPQSVRIFALIYSDAHYMYENVGIAPIAQEDMDIDAAYMYENVGIAPVAQEDMDIDAAYIYENVGIIPSSIDQTGDATHYQYENVENRPAGSEEELPPTIN